MKWPITSLLTFGLCLSATTAASGQHPGVYRPRVVTIGPTDWTLPQVPARPMVQPQYPPTGSFGSWNGGNPYSTPANFGGLPFGGPTAPNVDDYRNMPVPGSGGLPMGSLNGLPLGGFGSPWGVVFPGSSGNGFNSNPLPPVGFGYQAPPGSAGWVGGTGGAPFGGFGLQGSPGPTGLPGAQFGYGGQTYGSGQWNPLQGPGSSPLIGPGFGLPGYVPPGSGLGGGFQGAPGFPFDINPIGRALTKGSSPRLR
jgi:hypothetical protein